MSDDITTLSLTEVAHALATRTLSAVEVTRACLARTEHWQASRNAFLHIDAEGALAAARRCDQTRATNNPLGALHGVPLAHKDMFYRQGAVCTGGSRIRRDWVATDTATVLSRLDDAGALCTGTLNMAEFAGGPTGHNPHWGDCGNAHHPDYMPGGSSSGSGSAVGACLVYGSLGSDTGGSVRLPAAANGVVGLKPTYGLISRHGALPRSWTLDHVGILTRRAADCALLLGTVAGHDPLDATSSARAMPDYLAALKQPVRGLRIGVPDLSIVGDVDPQVMQALHDSLDVLVQAGARVVPVPLDAMDTLFAVAETIIKSEGASIHGPWLRSRPHDYSPLLRSRTEAGMLIPATQYIDALRLRSTLTARFLDTTMHDIDVLHLPVIPFPVPTLAQCDVDAQGGVAVRALIGQLTRFTRPINLLGLPAISVPCGFCRNGLPMAFQLVGHPFQEATLLALAHRFEQDTPHHRRLAQH